MCPRGRDVGERIKSCSCSQRSSYWLWDGSLRLSRLLRCSCENFALAQILSFSTVSAQSEHSRPPVHFERRTPQFKPQPQRPRLAGGGRSHSCRNFDCERLAGHVGLLPPHAPTEDNGRVVPS